ncbi:MAG: hypothetical protein NTW21_20100 [Verrucomicrobia bacterium]|nr:hypothetical protein [Verrucomicrobiota bacterium]
MIRFLPGLALLLGCVAPGLAAEPSRVLRVSNDGLVRFSSTSGETTWTGTLTIEHPRFQLAGRGTASLFGGPALRRKSAKAVPLKTAEFEAETEWISLVVLGSLTITVADGNGVSKVVTAQRVVYVPAADRLLIDGKPWHFKPQTANGSR